MPQGFAARGSACMVCGVDLWDVERYVSAGAVVICQSCVDVFKRALDAADGTGEIEVLLPAPPPRVHGSAPDEGAAAAVVEAFTRTFDSDEDRLDDALEDAAELGALLAQARGRVGPANRFGARVEGIRFRSPDRAEVRFQVLMNGNAVAAFEGSAARRGGCWRVTRETIARMLANYGVTVPPRRSS
jgi:hypothetical protein